MSADGISQTGPEDRDMADGGVAGGAEWAAALERRYLRLLRCYPPSHREVHREEMLGVLLAAARPGQRAPGARQAVNLAACGLAIRARRALSWLAGQPWQDALAVMSLIAPVLMLVIAAQNFVVPAPAELLTPPGRPAIVARAALMIFWLAVVLLGLTGRRRTAAAIASVPLALGLLTVQAPAILAGLADVLGVAWFAGLGIWPPIFMSSLAACSLAFSAGPRTGMAIAGRRRACLMLACLSCSFELPVIVTILTPFAPWAASLAVSLLRVLAIVVAIVVTRVRGTVDWRASALAAPALLIEFASIIPFGAEGPIGSTALMVLWLGCLVLAVLAWPVAIASWRGRVRRASRAGTG